MESMPLLTLGEVPLKYKGIVEGMTFLVDSHTKLCKEEYIQQALLTIKEDGFLNKCTVTAIVYHTLTQYSMKKDLTKLGDKVRTAMSMELSQLHNCEAFSPLKASMLSCTQRKGHLSS